MSLFTALSARKASFYFLERSEIAATGPWELIASIAHWYRPGATTATLPDLFPVWQGSYLPHEATMDRWALPDVWAVTIGTPSAELRRALVAYVRDHRPWGMFDLDANSDALRLPLVLAGLIVPDGYIRFAASGMGPLRHA